MVAGRSGFSTVESLVALVVLMIGVAGAGASSVLAIRVAHRAHLRSRLALYAEDRLEWLERQSRDPLTCQALADSSLTHPEGILEHWGVVAAPRGWLVTLSLSAPSRPTWENDTLRTRLACGW